MSPTAPRDCVTRTGVKKAFSTHSAPPSSIFLALNSNPRVGDHSERDFEFRNRCRRGRYLALCWLKNSRCLSDLLYAPLDAAARCRQMRNQVPRSPTTGTGAVQKNFQIKMWSHSVLLPWIISRCESLLPLLIEISSLRVWEENI